MVDERNWSYERDAKVTEDDDNEDDKVTLAQQIFGKAAAAISGRNLPERKTDNVTEAEAPPVATRDSPVSEISPWAAAKSAPIEGAAQQRELKTAAELAEMIELNLARHPDCPKAGFRVTVYGGSYWRAMLTITPAAGAVRDPAEWRELTNDLAERLRVRYDLASE
jgi:hypothetical protein